MRERGSKLPGPKGGPEREEQVMIIVVEKWWIYFGGASLDDCAFGEPGVRRAREGEAGLECQWWWWRFVAGA